MIRELDLGNHLTGYYTDNTMKVDDLNWLVEENSGPMYRRLEIYEEAEQIANSIWDIAVSWDPFVRETIGKQLVRSADSIAANLSEGSGRGTIPELLRFARIARGSLCETQHWLRRAKKRSLISEASATNLESNAERLLKRTNAFISRLKQKP